MLFTRWIIGNGCMMTARVGRVGFVRVSTDSYHKFKQNGQPCSVF
jgi:hypothetical protein